MTQIGNHTNIEIEEDLLRHMVLNSLRSYNVKFRAQYGEMVIACDDRFSWRRNCFPYYKANRRKDREKSEINWPKMFEILEMIRSEIHAFLPYRVLHVSGAEADDIIGTLVNTFQSTEEILIISGDKDFRQLHTSNNVNQYDPVRKKWIAEKNPTLYLKEHIIRGDVGDGIPNILSGDDVFITNQRQRPISKKKLDVWLTLDPDVFCDNTMIRGWYRNQQLVDLSHTPDHIRDEILLQYTSQGGKTRSNIFTYFVSKRLKNLMESISDF